ncbi:MAG TPA: hypothetical protein VHD87_13000 [Acidimicrobiales bacterium]|nr:hypothetical protein [Acidimicrobiales bacterium]
MTSAVATQLAGIVVGVVVYGAAVRGALGYRWETPLRSVAAAIVAGATVVTFGPWFVASVRSEGLLVVVVWIVLIGAVAVTLYERVLFRNRFAAYAAAGFVALLVFAPVWASSVADAVLAVVVPYLGLIVVGFLALRFARR